MYTPPWSRMFSSQILVSEQTGIADRRQQLR
jgi:hypothetical protein